MTRASTTFKEEGMLLGYQAGVGQWVGTEPKWRKQREARSWGRSQESREGDTSSSWELRHFEDRQEEHFKEVWLGFMWCNFPLVIF